jgi:uncharacterized protein YqhQ
MSKNCLSVGGQAVIEGVMMKGPEYMATAVRKTSGEIVYRKKEVTKKNKFMSKIPFLRGAVVLYEALIMGTSELTFAANQSDEDEEELKDFQLVMTVVFAMALGIGLFMVLPSLIGGFIFPSNRVYSNIMESILRLVIFVSYIQVLSFSKDIKRLYEYHGAEHKSIYAYENCEELKKENAKKYTTLHPRCGTSFLLIVMICSIVLFSIADYFIPQPERLLYKQLLRVGLRIGLMPIIAGLSYEVQRFTSRHLENNIVKTIAKPGLALQKITTKEPDMDQLEVSMVALRVALGENVDNAREIFE